MIKALLGTSALAGLALFTMTSSPAYGEVLTSGAIAPSLKIDGFTAINSYFINQQQRQNGKGGPQPHVAVDVSNLFFTIMGTSASGIEYMYGVIFETVPGTGNIIDQNYVQIKSKLGTLQIGGTVGPEDTMIWDGGKIIGGTGAFDGGFNNVYNMSAGVMRGNDNVGDTGNATKIVYYSPEFMGWSFGIAYTPSTAHRGDGKLDNMTGSEGKFPGNRGLFDYKGHQPYDLRNIAIGLIYRKEIGQWNITLSGAGITAKSYFYNSRIVNSNGVISSGRVPFQNTKAYQLGFVIGYGDFRFGGGYLDNGKSHLPRTANFTYGNSDINLTTMNNGNAGHAWNIAAGYTMGAYQFAAAYQRTNRNTGNLQKAHSDFYSATVDVTPLNGLKVYSEVDYIRSRSNDTAVERESAVLKATKSANLGTKNNSGLLGIVGTKISF